VARRTIAPGDGDPAHGSVNGYVNLRCRGGDCQAAWNDYAKKRRESDPAVTKTERLAKKRAIVHPAPDTEEEPYVFQRPPVKRIEKRAEARIPADAEPLLPWMTERLVVLDYNPEVKVVRDGDELVVRVCLSLMPAEAAEPGWAKKMLLDAIEWAKGDPRLVAP
jgi:hypothetical protein